MSQQFFCPPGLYVSWGREFILFFLVDFQTPAQCGKCGDAWWTGCSIRADTHCHFLFLHKEVPHCSPQNPARTPCPTELNVDFSMSCLKLLPLQPRLPFISLFSHSFGYFGSAGPLLLRGLSSSWWWAEATRCRAWTSHCDFRLLQNAGSGYGGFNGSFLGSRAQA